MNKKEPIVSVSNLAACISVANLDETAKWYNETLGFRIFLSIDFPELSAKVAYLENDSNVRIELAENGNFISSPRPEPPGHTALQGVSQISFWVNDIDSIREKIRNASISVAMELITVDELGVKAFFIRDNEGNLIEFLELIRERKFRVDTEKTERIVREFYDNIAKGDSEAIMNALAEDIVFELPQDEFNKIISYLGTKVGHEQVAEAFRIRGETTVVQAYELRRVVTQGNTACVIVYTKASHTRTNVVFEIEDSHHLTVNDKGKISHWKVYFDPNAEINAFSVDLDTRLIAAARHSDADEIKHLLAVRANPNAREDSSGLTALMIAAGAGNAEMTKILIDAGADYLAVDKHAGTSVLHKACQGGNVEVVRLLVETGAFIDTVAPTTGHTPLMDALWFKYPDIVQYLLDNGASLNLYTHYGFSLLQHFEYELNVNIIGKNKMLQAETMLNYRRQSDERQVQNQKLMAAVTNDDIKGAKALIQAGVNIEERYPKINGFNDFHTPLLVACRDGHTEIVSELLKAGADVNVTEPTFGAVPLHKAVYNGHADITRMLVEQPGININFQGLTNGYTPLHDALWHGYAECAEILINAGARLDLRGHDNKQPVDIAIEVFGEDHTSVRLIQSKMSAS